MKSKRALSILLALVFVLTLLPAVSIPVKADVSGTCGTNLTWTLSDSGVLTISGSGNMIDFTTSTQDAWRYKRHAITRVVISSGVTSIGANAFYNCYSLTGVTISSSVKTIGEQAFGECTKLTGITIPYGVLEIGSRAFLNTPLVSLAIPDTATSIGDEAFLGCKQLKQVNIGNGVVNIGTSAFDSNEELSYLRLGSGLRNIGYRAFAYCPISVLVLPSGLTYIDGRAFLDCPLDVVVIPNSIEVIRDYAFSSSGEYYYCGAESEWSQVALDTNSFDQLNIHYNSHGGFFSNNLGWGLGQDGLLSIGGNGAITGFSSPSAYPWYSYQTGITSVWIGDGITEIPIGLFRECSNLISISVDWGNERYSSENDVLFKADGADGNTLIAFPSGKVGEYYVPENVTSIEDYAFVSCSSLDYIEFLGAAPRFGEHAFQGTSTIVKYPNDDPTWTTDVMQNYGGALNWIANLTAPTITTQPANKTVAEGEKATFKVVASGDDLTYQWQYSKNGTTWTDKAGASSASYTVTAKASYNGLYYRCKVSNAGGEVFSNKAKLTVTSTAAPTITTQPANKTVAAGEKATFRVVASGTGLTYQWQYSKNGTTWTDKAGATSASYTVTAKASYNGMLYRCIVTNAGGSVTSGTAKLTVTVAKPVITTQPKAQTAAVGATATYKVVASGTGLTYQWQYSNDYGATWHNKTGATSASYTVTAKASYNGMLYRCRVKNSGGTVYSSKVRLTVSGVKPKVLSQPKAATAAAGGTATFKVVAAGESMSYQWQYSTDGGTTWKNKTGATSASYTVTAKASYNGILYRCRVKNSYGTVYSESAKLTVS